MKFVIFSYHTMFRSIWPDDSQILFIKLYTQQDAYNKVHFYLFLFYHLSTVSSDFATVVFPEYTACRL
jgi:hypothetical protein